MYSLLLSMTRLPQDLIKKLQTLLRSPSCPEQFQILSSAILRESLPLSLNSFSADFSQDSRALSYIASVVLSQVLSQGPPSHIFLMFMGTLFKLWFSLPRLEVRRIYFLSVSICWKVWSQGSLRHRFPNTRFPFSANFLAALHRFSMKVSLYWQKLTSFVMSFHMQYKWIYMLML